MANFKIEFKCDNAAFYLGDDEFTEDEIVRVLREEVPKSIAARGLDAGGTVYDINGNSIGHWEFTK
jgi:hypothetical protein